MHGKYTGVNPVSTAFVVGMAAGVGAEWFWRRRSRDTRAVRSCASDDLIVRADVHQVPAASVAAQVESFVRDNATRCARGGSLSCALSQLGPFGARVYAFERETGKRKSASGWRSNDCLTGRELELWRECCAAGGGWCAYLNDSGGGWLACEYVFVAPAGSVFFSSGIKVGS